MHNLQYALHTACTPHVYSPLPSIPLTFLAHHLQAFSLVFLDASAHIRLLLVVGRRHTVLIVLEYCELGSAQDFARHMSHAMEQLVGSAATDPRSHGLGEPVLKYVPPPLACILRFVCVRVWVRAD